MINSIASSPPPPSGHAQNAASTLNNAQKSLINKTLENIDADTLTQDQAIKIVETFSAAGIKPSKELASTLADAGFDARTIGDLAQSASPSSQQSNASQIDLSELVDYLDTLLESLSGNSLSSADKAEVYDSLRERFSLNEGDSILNVTA